MTTQQALEALQGLVRDVSEGEKQRQETGLSAEAFAVFYILKAEGIANPVTIARVAEESFGEFRHWRTSERQAQELRKALYKALIDADVEDVVGVVGRLMKILRRERS